MNGSINRDNSHTGIQLCSQCDKIKEENEFHIYKIKYKSTVYIYRHKQCIKCHSKLCVSTRNEKKYKAYQKQYQKTYVRTKMDWNKLFNERKLFK